MTQRKTLDVVGVDERLTLYVSDEVPLTSDERGVVAARDRLAEQMGEEADAIRIANTSLASKLMQAGVVINLHIGCWTGKRKLTAADLGLDDLDGATAQRVRKAINLGEVALAPPTLLRRRDSVIVRMRRNLDRYSYSTAWGSFVPAASYSEWKKRHEELVAEFFSIRDDLVNNIDQLWMAERGMWAELRLTYRAHAPYVWCRIQRLQPTEENLAQTPDWFVDEYVDRILSTIPSTEYIRDSFYVEAVPTYIPLPSIMEEDAIRAEQLRARSEAEIEMQREVSRYYVERKEKLVDEFLSAVIGELRSRVYDVVTAAIASLDRNNGQLVGKTAQGLRNLITWVESMDIYDDQEIQAGLRKLRSQLDRAAGSRDVAAIRKQLKALGTVARSTLLDLNLSPKIENPKLSVKTRDALLGLSSIGHRALAAQAREELGTDGIPELGIVKLRRLQAREL